MGLFDNLQKKGSKALQGQPMTIRKEAVKVSIDPSQSPSPMVHSRTPPPGNKPLLSVTNDSKTDFTGKHARSDRSSSKKRSWSPQPRFDSSDSNEDQSSIDGTQRKRIKPSSGVEIDQSRRIGCETAFDDVEDQDGRIHAASLTSGINGAKYAEAFPTLAPSSELLLRFPSALHAERYALMFSTLPEEFAPLDEIKECISVMIRYYLPESEASEIGNEDGGILRKLQRAVNKRDGNTYRSLIGEWNERLCQLRQSGAISRRIDKWQHLELPLIERILTQTYSRTVSPRANELRRYENGTDDVYGELLPKFVSDILRRDTRMNSTQVFVDLGSGVGNVVFQAALQVGCESWGCEKMPTACDLAVLQEHEFKARCRLWGLSHGNIHLERGDFLSNRPIRNALSTADVVLVNNQAFTAGLNEDLTNLFLDLKNGCLVVSLRSFVPSDHKISMRNINRPYNQLQVRKREYYSKCVSWTDAPGSYYVSKKDDTRVKRFLEMHQ